MVGSKPKPGQRAAGGSGGTQFDSGNNRTGVAVVEVGVGGYNGEGTFLLSIRLTFNNQDKTRKLGGGAINQTWRVPPGEKITQVITWSGWVCDAVQFVTNEGSKSPKFGGGGGGKKVWTAPRGQAMTGIFGGHGGLVDSLGINFDKTSMLRGPPEPMLKLVWSCEGGSNGSKTVKTFSGSQRGEHISSALQSEISVSIGGALKAFTGSMDAKIAAQFESSVDTSSYEKKEETLKVSFDKPCYIYQMLFNVPTHAGNVSFGGGQVIMNHPVSRGK